MLAALQGSILLIAAMAEHDYRTNVEAKKEVEELMALNNKQLAMIEELVKELKAKN